MKKIGNILFLIAVLGVVISCDRELESEGIATGVIRFPSIEMQGDAVQIISAGSTYTDAGAKAFLGAEDISSQLDIDNNVNAAVGGVYTVDYTVTTVNELDQESTVIAQRIVVVAPANPNTAVDLSGTYARSTNGAPAVWTKVADGVYTNDNIGGVLPPSPAVIPVYVLHYSNGTITVPVQPSSNGPISAAITLLPNGYTVVVNNPGFLTNTRTFIKQ
jgi:hypothetical protein